MDFKSKLLLDIVDAQHLDPKFVDSDMLASAYQSYGKPHEMGNKLTQLFASKSNFWEAKPLLGTTEGSGKVEMIDNEVYRWYLEGSETCAVIVAEKLVEDGSRPGLNGEPFEIKFTQKRFSVSEVITGEDENYPLIVVEGPIYEGGMYKYVVKPASDTNFEYPEYLLEAGREFTKAYNINNLELTRERGGQAYNERFRLQSQIGAFGQELMVTDRAMREDLRSGANVAPNDGKLLSIPFKWKDKKTGAVKTANKFMMMAEAKMHEELAASKEYALWLGHKYTTLDKNGYIKRMGPGVRQQMLDGWIHRYSGALTERMLQEYLMDIFFSRLSQGDRKVRSMTGTGGSFMFHDLLASSAASFLTVDSNYISKVNTRGFTNELRYGAQFTKYIGLEGIEVELWYNPLYDSTKFSKRRHPQYKDRPLDSYRMTFLDFGSATVNNIPSDNIKMLKLKNYSGYGYEESLINRAGLVKQGEVVSNSNFAGVKFYVDDTAGVNIVDPTRGGELILDFEA
jgi:hypothetical protein